MYFFHWEPTFRLHVDNNNLTNLTNKMSNNVLSISCFLIRLLIVFLCMSATPPVWQRVCLCSFLLSQLCVYWYVAINRRQFNLQICHSEKQNCVKNNYRSQSLFGWSNYNLFSACHSVFSFLPISHRHTRTHPDTLAHTCCGNSFIISWATQGSAPRTVSQCHVRGISAWFPQRGNYSDAFRCPLSHAFRALLGAEEEAKWMWQA